MNKRVLLLSYYFPPAGGPGVQRVLKFAKYLPAFDWDPVVLTVQQGAYPARDPSLGEEVPESVQVHRTSSLDPHWVYARLSGRSDESADVGSVRGGDQGFLATLARWVRANVFLPDARVGWVPFAVWRGLNVLRTGEIDAIVTSGPPHSTHLSGAALAGRTGIPWVADFRDPWTDINYYQELPHTSLARRVDAFLERLVLRRANAVTTVSPTWRDLLAGKEDYLDRDSFRVVQNGFDEDDISPLGAASPSTDHFYLTHVGSLYASRAPTAVWNAIRRLRDRGEISRLRIRLVGSVDSTVRTALEEQGLAEIAEHVPYVPHEEAVAYMRRAGLLLLSIEPFPAAAGMITGKIYEYLASGRPVLGLGPPAGDAQALLQKTEGGQLFGRDDVSGLAQFISTHYEAWETGDAKEGAKPSALRPYRRRAQTKRLAEVLTSVVQ